MNYFFSGALFPPVFWLMVPRLVLSLAVVWAERLRRTLFRATAR
jgi:hypothetical protein